MWKCKKCGKEVVRYVSGNFLGHAELDKTGDINLKKVKMDVMVGIKLRENYVCDCSEYDYESYIVEEIAEWIEK